jgi:putative spermidine/putrescine transport system ATP-binding protein/putrescine transport system ATP-binding protein
MIAGFMEPDQGSVLITGRDMRGVRPYERNIGLVFQDYALFPHLTVAQNIAYGLRRQRRSKTEIAERVDAMCRLVRLAGFEGRRPAELSGGQQQRVALARALAIGPQLLLLDEPLSALDAKLRHDLRFELKQILRETNCTTLIVTHDQEEAMSLADRVVVMHQGRMLQEGSPISIYGTPANRVVADLIGRANWFEGRLTADAAGPLATFLGDDGQFLVPNLAELGGKHCQLCVRPERLLILRPEEGADGINLLEGSLVNAAFLGKEVHYAIRLASGREVLIVESARDQEIPASDSPMRVGFRPTDCVVIPVR